MPNRIIRGRWQWGAPWARHSSKDLWYIWSFSSGNTVEDTVILLPITDRDWGRGRRDMFMAKLQASLKTWDKHRQPAPGSRFSPSLLSYAMWLPEKNYGPFMGCNSIFRWKEFQYVRLLPNLCKTLKFKVNKALLSFWIPHEFAMSWQRPPLSWTSQQGL